MYLLGTTGDKRETSKASQLLFTHDLFPEPKCL